MAIEEIVTPRRLETLTDGIFAFSMTLLVIFIDVPQSHHLSGPAELQRYLSTELPAIYKLCCHLFTLGKFLDCPSSNFQ